MNGMNSHPETMDLDNYRAIPARARWHALRAVGRVRVRPHDQSRPRAGYRRLPGVLVKYVLTNMLDYGAEHFKLRQLDMPENFFCGNNCVAEYGQFPSNFLLGVSTPSNDIQFRRQMRSRLGEPVTVAGNPPVKLASVSFEAENKTYDCRILPCS